MNLPFHAAPRRRGARAFTLVEIMVAMTIFTFVIGGIVYAHLAGLKLRQITRLKLGASDQARLAIQRLISEVRTAKRVEVGNGDANSFVKAASQTLQQGTALEIYPTTNFTQSIRYYISTNDATLYRADLRNGAVVTTVANHLNNNVVFTSEDHTGTVLTDNQNNRVIGLYLQFHQIQYPVTQIGAGNYFDFYQVRTKITRRSLE